MKHRITMREILLGACASYMNCSEECLKKYKTWELLDLANKLERKEIENNKNK